jgi:hypothetical protein
MQYVKIIEGQMPMKPVHGLLVRDWKEEVVNLVQYPRTHTIVSPTPFALKLETWIRMNGIKYHVSLHVLYYTYLFEAKALNPSNIF